MNPYSQAPHVEGPSRAPADAPNAALLIDFDNVTMGMRSDLSKELKTLLQSDVIRGKVTVQRAYADWRRYPQYIVPLSEASVDLIFAPAYGSSKKNATDIRMAIDGVELVFIRPEIGTFILLTGDSDFSSLVLKLKEYGKYVIGVGIQESSSDIMIQNCDEYYSYTSLTGLRKTTEIGGKADDPWALVEKAVSRMTTRGDVMRSDRLKQVMLELDGRFSEGNFGFSKFSKFIAEAANRGLVRLHKLENGQYEVQPGSGRKSAEGSAATREPRERGRPVPRRGRPARTPRAENAGGGETREVGPSETRAAARDSSSGGELAAEPLRAAYGLMVRCLQKLGEMGKDSTRDSDVKRKMLEADRGFDEGELGFGKFSRFLLQAQEDGVISLEKTATGNYHVSLPDSGAEASQSVANDRTGEAGGGPATPATEAVSSSGGEGSSARRLGPRGGSGGRRETVGPVLLEGQIVGRVGGTQDRSSAGTRIDAGGLGLPTSERAIVSYLTNSYGGVGKKTAEALVEAFRRDIFSVFENEPGRVAEIVPRRAPQVLAEWKSDFARRSGPSRNDQERTSESDHRAESDQGSELDNRAEPDHRSESDSGAGADGVAGPVLGRETWDANPGSRAETVPPSNPSPPSTPRSGGARRRTRPSPSRRPSSGSDE